MSTLHAFTNDYETYLAEDMSGAWKAYSEDTEIKVGTPDFDDNWWELEDDETISIRIESQDYPTHIVQKAVLAGCNVTAIGNGTNIVVATVSQWAVWNGTGFLCSTEQ